MGLPIWRNPEEDTRSSRSATKPSDPTAPLRSSIRRRPSVHGRRSTRPRLSRQSSLLPPRFERSPPPSSGFNGLREARRGEDRGVPSISNLLEAANRDFTIRPPVPGDYSRHTIDLRNDDDDARRRFDDNLASIEESERSIHRSVERLRQYHARIRLRREHENELNGSTNADIGGRRAPSPPVNGRDLSAPRLGVLLDPGEPLRIIRSPEPMSRRSRPHSRNGSNARRSALPTPPLDGSRSDESTESVHERRGPTHPLSNSWRADSPVDGLGDRNRSPTPGDGWEIMRATIAPDETLPSAESSFASAAASQSFNASSSSTQITEPDMDSLASRRDAITESDIASSIDPDDLSCLVADGDINSSALAYEMYMFEMQTSAGRRRIAHHERLRAQEGISPDSLEAQPEIEIGFRLVEEALDTPEGRERLLRLRNQELENLDDERVSTPQSMMQRLRELREERQRRDSPLSVGRRPSGETMPATREARRQVHGYFQRVGADSLTRHSLSPPPEYDLLNSQPDGNTLASQDRPEAHPVSPPSQRSEREVSEALLSGDIQDLDSMRRIVERLAARDDVPEEWWMSIGLNLSRTRMRDRSPRRRTEEGRDVVRTGRIERGNSRL